jgi:hypothetical protein
MRATFKHFESSPESWETLFAAAADFASEVGADRLISGLRRHEQRVRTGGLSSAVE